MSINDAAKWIIFLIDLVVDFGRKIRLIIRGKDCASQRAITPMMMTLQDTAPTRNTFSGLSFFGYVILYLLPQIASGANPPVAAGHPLSRNLPPPPVLSNGFNSNRTISIPV